MEKKYNARQILQAALSAVFLLAMLTILKPCGPKDDGTFMHCHEAGTALCVLSCVMLLFSLAAVFLKNSALRIVCDIIAAASAVAAMILPGNVISLCMAADMRCRSVMRPGAIAFSALILLICVFSVIGEIRAKKS